MKPDFALSLSMEGIVFLCRAESGWHMLGEVPLDHPDLGSALSKLRAEGEALVEGPAACKIILPNDQIKYIQINASETDAEAQVAAALDGATPYAIDQLAYDFTEVDDVFQIAAVAVETLQEAEAFAVEHGFSPVGFVAIPGGDEFEGEPFFGATQGAARYLGSDEFPEPDEEPVFATGRGAPIDFVPLYSKAVKDEVPASFSSSRLGTPKAVSAPPEPEPAPSAPPATDVAPKKETIVAPSVIEPSIIAPAEPIEVAPAAPSVSQQSTRFDPATLAAGLKPRTKSTVEKVLEVANPTPRPRSTALSGKPKRQTKMGTREKTLALYVIAVLVVLLAGIVTWAALFTPAGVAGLWTRSGDTQIALTPDSETGIETNPLAPISPDTITDSAEIEALEDAIDDPVENAIEPRLQAEARYAATGIWDLAPGQPLSPGLETTEDIAVGSFEISQQTHDAIALPQLDTLQVDLALAPQFDPLPAGTELDLDERGLVVATREGALSPEWIMVYSGKPAVVPASFPTRQEVVAQTETAIDDEARLRLASVRPEIRPGDLVEQNERATLGGSTLSELAKIRPQVRPDDAALNAAASVVASLDPADLEGATEQAVLSSLRPSTRPANFEQTVAAIKERMASVAVPEAATTVPSIPSSASVARSATQTNAINLRKINLIGVYGTSSDRRALVRLATGRYKKVKVGDTLDGGRVRAIGDSELSYVKGSRNIVLALPKG